MNRVAETSTPDVAPLAEADSNAAPVIVTADADTMLNAARLLIFVAMGCVIVVAGVQSTRVGLEYPSVLLVISDAVAGKVAAVHVASGVTAPENNARYH